MSISFNGSISTVRCSVTPKNENVCVIVAHVSFVSVLQWASDQQVPFLRTCAPPKTFVGRGGPAVFHCLLCFHIFGECFSEQTRNFAGPTTEGRMWYSLGGSKSAHVEILVTTWFVRSKLARSNLQHRLVTCKTSTNKRAGATVTNKNVMWLESSCDSADARGAPGAHGTGGVAVVCWL